MGGRLHYLARELARLGHDVTVVGARKHHLLRDDVDTDALPAEEEVDGYRLLRLDVPRYTHAHDKRRILAWFTFAAKLPGLKRRLNAFPDAVLYSSPQLIGYLGAERLARTYGARLVFEVRDIWPRTLVEIGGHDARHPFIRLLQWIEDRAYSCADRVVSNLEGAVEHMATRGMCRRKFSWVSNGIALDEVAIPAPLASDMAAQIPPDGFRIIYAGTLGAANALDTLVEAAALLRNETDIHILLVGKGRERTKLEARRDELGLTNVRFLGSVPKLNVQSVLTECDACYIGWLKSPLYRWGIAANKVPEYLFSSRPIVHGFSGGNDPVVKFEAGVTIPPEDPQALADAIRRLRDMPQAERRRMGENGRRAALEHYDYAKLAKRLEQVLLD
ncbi:MULTISPECIES: glycosyltransferase family 4 protein [unclassified Yoonia]|uniref:glycosyltransferase family 4 protein n=1 Tax=unclassified Yoonia TaxID=2629118 RepID=UPI002AFE2DF0|nr:MULTISPECIES: glycosyltransferase family 4 protein [unclassified Yoonia]